MLPGSAPRDDVDSDDSPSIQIMWDPPKLRSPSMQPESDDESVKGNEGWYTTSSLESSKIWDSPDSYDQLCKVETFGIC